MMILSPQTEKQPWTDLIELLYAKERDRFFQLAKDILKNEADAEDVVQECFLRLTEKASLYSGKPYDELMRITTTIVTNESLNIWRFNQKFAPLAKNDLSEETQMLGTSPDILSQLEDKYEGTMITQAVMKLPKIDREILGLFYGYQLTSLRISILVGTSHTFVRKSLYNSRIKLAKILQGKAYKDLFPDT